VRQDVKHRPYRHDNCSAPLFVNLAGAEWLHAYADGRLMKGYTYDFQPGRDRFDIFPDPSPSPRPPAPVTLADLEAVFFVRDLEGNRGTPNGRTSWTSRVSQASAG